MKKCRNNFINEDAKTTDLLKLIISTIMKSAIPLVPIPSMLLLIGAKMRPGISPRKIAARVLNKLSDEGIPVGPMNGKPNMTAKLVEAITSEMSYAIKNEGKVESAIAPGAIQVTVVGGNAGGPITATGMNTNLPSINGVMS